MAKPNMTATATPRAPRKARVLTPLEIEVRQQFLDAKSLAKIIPAIDKLGPWGREKLTEHIKPVEAGSNTMS